VVVIGGMGSIMGAMLTGLGLGLLEGLAKAVYPEVSSTVIFVAMVVILILRPRGLLGKVA
jgi:branched-chain amino acid transport system permease protein